MDTSKMIPVDKAKAIMLESVVPTGNESIPILEAQGRILYTDITSSINIPPLDNSAMDGYAVTSNSLASASGDTPAILPVRGEIQAGSLYAGDPLDGTFAVQIMTGAPIPEGADAVIKIEDTEPGEDSVAVFKSVKINENIRKAGEDIAKGMVVLKKGHLLKSADIGLLASLNFTAINVYRKPEVAIIATGDELVEPGEEINPGQIRNSNAYTLYTEIKKYNATPRYLGIARDSFENTREKFQKAFESDIVITTGGVSMGKYDFVKSVMADLDINIKVQKILMKPGKPLIFGTKGNKLFFGLPGNPVSTMVSFIQFVRPAILKFMGAKNIEKPLIAARLSHDIKKKPERRHFLRGTFTIENGEFFVSTTGSQGSGILSSMSHANCLIILPEGISLFHKDEPVMIQLIYHEEI